MAPRGLRHRLPECETAGETNPEHGGLLGLKANKVFNMDDEIIGKIRSRVERCRRLASQCTDPEIARSLRAMADEGEADVTALLASRGES